ncbi:hypothetical protein B0J11DRAFT_516853 [Dendryphion nanum]|uniref:ATP-dependent RNA helicase DHX8 n=1 Tax=Dendryphion nanum TaxID=256645 RepID=A0A9P9J2A0_9PLEO|nr:hypothetical protein B0J11DRAFT_516853 [Dendryphion nanum]
MATPTPYRQIRASYDESTITVYQAYSETIASAAIKHQKLDASPAFSLTRMTWIKPSWAWVLYRSGYSYKDKRQTHILALKLKKDVFEDLLRQAILSHKSEMQNADSGRKAKARGEAKPTSVRVQWDPERSIRLEKLECRSIQIGVPGALVPGFINGIVSIEDVTERARELKRVLDGEGEERVGLEELIGQGLVPVEKEYEVGEDLRMILRMESLENGDAA